MESGTLCAVVDQAMEVKRTMGAQMCALNESRKCSALKSVRAMWCYPAKVGVTGPSGPVGPVSPP